LASSDIDDGRGHVVGVRVVAPASGSKYVQTYADGIWTENLLSLPRRRTALNAAK
jgi:hypothetical protein